MKVLVDPPPQGSRSPLRILHTFRLADELSGPGWIEKKRGAKIKDYERSRQRAASPQRGADGPLHRACNNPTAATSC
jgi:hypothetical protein